MTTHISNIVLTDPDFPLLTKTDINQTGIVKDGDTISFNRLIALRTALQAVELPPNATTLSLNKTVQLTDLTNTATLGLDTSGNANLVSSKALTIRDSGGYWLPGRQQYPAQTSTALQTSVNAVSSWSVQNTSDTLAHGCCWSPELGIFVVVGLGTNRIRTSSDGINWTARTAPATNTWTSVCWAKELGLFCAVSNTGVANRVMTSPDGITWTSRDTTGKDNDWFSICWAPELTLFCVVSISGSGNRVMTSPDGITWTLRTSASDNIWNSVCWSSELRLFCAVGATGVNRVMTSTDGITWTLRGVTTSLGSLGSVTWSPQLGIFCAVGVSTVVRSSDGITWTSSSVSQTISGVCWSPQLNLFCASSSQTPFKILSSPDAITWTGRTVPVTATGQFSNICWSPELGIFIANERGGTGVRGIYSSLSGRPPTSANVFDSPYNRIDQSGNWTIQGTITNSTNAAIIAKSDNVTYYPTFVSATSGNNPIYADTTLTYNPSTDTLTCTNLAGTSTKSYTTVVNQSSGNIASTDCYGSTIYADTATGTLTLPAGVTGMKLYIINDSGGAITLAVQSGEYLDGVLDGTDNLTVGGGKPYMHTVICGATGKWFMSA